MTVRLAKVEDHSEWLRMRSLLWTDCTVAEHERDMRERLASGTPTFVSERAAGGLRGFVEVGIRQYAEGCDTDHIGYVEGWWVDEDCRRSAVGRALIAAAEDWARAQGCIEMASDALITNEGSRQAHERLGYVEQERIICFKKVLSPSRLLTPATASRLSASNGFKNLREQKQFLERLTETIAWCERMGSVKRAETSLGVRIARGLRGRTWFVGRAEPSLRTFKPECSELCSQSSGVRSISRQRSDALRCKGLTDLPAVTDLHGGRLLAYFPDYNLADGCAQSSSEGFFDVDNIPPHDTWVWMVDDRRIEKLEDGGTWETERSYLVAWVPPDFLELANFGIEVNPEECILWLDTLDHPLVHSLRRLKLIA